MIAMSVLMTRVVYLKIVHGAEYEAEAKKQQINRYDVERYFQWFGELISPVVGSSVM